MIIANSKIIGRRKELPLLALSKGLILTVEEKRQLKKSIQSITIVGVIDSDIAKPTESVELIYIVEVVLKDVDMPTEFIKAFDKQTVAHTIFEIPWNGDAIYMMANKRIKDGKISIGNHHCTEVIKEHKLEIGISETLEDIRSNLYAYVIGLDRRKGETADDLENRSKRIKELEREVEKLEKKKNAEVQFNKKVEINEQIRALKGEIDGDK